jgi:protein SCO1
MQKKVISSVIGLLAGVLLIWGVAFARPYTLRGSEIDPHLPAADITLSRADGSQFTLSDSHGKITLIFFGYTYCPDICPATLADMKRVKAELGQSADGVQFVFITVDPLRDTPERIHSYAIGFDPDFIGLSGSEDDLAEVWKAYFVSRQIQDTGSAAGYLVDHSTRVYLVDLDQNLRLTYAYGTAAADIAADIRYLLKE